MEVRIDDLREKRSDGKADRPFRFGVNIVNDWPARNSSLFFLTPAQKRRSLSVSLFEVTATLPGTMPRKSVSRYPRTVAPA